MSQRNKFVKRYDANDPCPVCGTGSKGCDLAENGSQFCRGEPAYPEAWKKVSESKVGGFKVYRPIDALPDNPTRTKKEKLPPPVNWSARAVHFNSMLNSQVRVGIAASLGVPVEKLALIPLLGTSGGSLSGGPTCVIPEVDADGVIVGLMERVPDRDPKSKMITGGNRGVTLTVGWDAATESPLLLAEGGTGPLACAAAGLSVLGRPGAEGGVDILIQMLKKLPPTRPIIVVGDNDPRINGGGKFEWPGRDGMRKTAGELAAAVPNPILQAIVPNSWGDEKPVKDARDWLTDARHGNKPWADRGAELLAGLLTAAAEPVPVHPLESPAGPVPASSAEPPAAGESDDPDRWAVPFDAPQRLAAAYLAAVSPPDAPLRLRHWRDEFHEWRENCYHTVVDGEMRARLNLFIAAEFERVQRLQYEVWKPKADRGGKFPQAAKVTTALVTSTLASLASLCGVGMTNADAPAWVGDTAGRPPVQEIAAFRNGLLHVTTGRLLPLTPEFFNFSTLAFDYDPAAPTPAAWLQFLAETWPGDREAVDCLQEWFGYLLTPDTRQQKMLWLVGPPRSGKGTTIEVLMNLVGEANVSSPTLQQLPERFGLSPLINSSVAWFDEPKISKHDNVPLIVGIIKRITGGSRVDIDRKGIPILKNVRLGCRFVLSANEVLELGDASGAMASRVIVISTSVSKIDREDKTLIDRLKAELPGIFNWALAGLPRLAGRGRFVQPASGMSDAAQLKDLGSPISQFLAECVVFDDAAEVSIDSLFDEYKKWCEGENRLGVGTKIGFSRDLRSMIPNKHWPVRKVVDGNRTRCCSGIRLRRFYETTDPVSDLDPIRAETPMLWEGSERQPSSQRTIDDVRSDETDQSARIIRASAQMDDHIRADSTLRSSSTYVDSGLSTQMNHKLDTNITEGGVSGVEGVHMESMGWNSVSSGHPGTTSNDDLYFTSEMQILNYPPNNAPVIQLGSVTHYLVTPSTTVTLLAMRDRAPPGSDRDALDAALAPICDYLVRRYPPDEIAAAEARGALPLPEPPRVPMM